MQFDCHAHVYQSTTVVAGARYAPASPAPLASWLELVVSAGLRGGVLVQPSFFGVDNSQLLNVLAGLDRDRFRGVAVVPLSSDRKDLAALRAAGIRGLRWNCVQGAPLPDTKNREVATFLARMSNEGLHLELHLEEPRLGSYLPMLLPHVSRLVIDHFGLPSGPVPAWPGAVPSGLESRVYIKLSAPYRSAVSSDPDAAVSALLETFPSQNFVWGSDWPWTRNETGRDYGKLASRLLRWTRMGADISAGARALYGL